MRFLPRLTFSPAPVCFTCLIVRKVTSYMSVRCGTQGQALRNNHDGTSYIGVGGSCRSKHKGG